MFECGTLSSIACVLLGSKWLYKNNKVFAYRCLASNVMFDVSLVFGAHTLF